VLLDLLVAFLAHLVPSKVAWWICGLAFLGILVVCGWIVVTALV
jgi:hypothetical protein